LGAKKDQFLEKITLNQLEENDFSVKVNTNSRYKCISTRSGKSAQMIYFDRICFST